MIDTEKREVASLAVEAGDYVDVLVLRDKDTNWVMLDDRDGVCPLSIDGRQVDRWELLRWLPTVRDVTVELDRDPQRYDAVTAARFTGRPK